MQVFREERGGDSADRILAVYGQAIEAGHGAVLFSVVGGKMSEGINFKDDMGRYAGPGAT
jgi:chromosome transmission fidelity protein 1